MSIKKIIIHIGISIVSVILTLLIAEGITQLYVYQIAKKGKLFMPDKTVGWVVKPQIRVKRKNANSQLWEIRTNENGFRQNSKWNSNKQKILILGDSFAFGQGVNIEDRFDNVFTDSIYSVLNTGVMGFGTDQQFLIALPFFEQLNKGDKIIILTYYNDFYDLLAKTQSGRSKPWFEFQNERFHLNKPEISINERLRDRSYIYTKINILLNQHYSKTSYDIKLACQIYEKLIYEIIYEVNHIDVEILIVYHGIGIIKDKNEQRYIKEKLNLICTNSQVQCLDLDQQFDSTNDSSYFLKDGHWNANGHKQVGLLLKEDISEN